MSDWVVRAYNLGRRTGETWLLQDVSLVLHVGEILSLAGPSGSGKTVLLRSLALLDPLDTGEVHWSIGPIRDNVPTYRSRVIYLHQRPTLTEGSVEDNLQQPFSLRVHRHRRFDRDQVISWFSELGRESSFLSQPQAGLSGGESQFVALVRALQLHPDVLLLDEPTAAMDSATTLAAERLLSHWLGEKTETRAMVWVTHDADQAARLAHRQLTMRGGRLDMEAA